MTGDVIRLDERRENPPGGGCAICPCGSGWFELRIPGADRPGVVCLSPDGTVSGYAGAPYCMECGTLWAAR